MDLPTPVNYQEVDRSDAAVSAAAAYALHCGLDHVRKAAAEGLPLQGRTVLEIGPGTDFGAPLVMACFGARVAVADAWLSPWRAGYHDRVYSQLADRLEAAHPEVDPAPLRRLAAAGGYSDDVLELIGRSADDLVGTPDHRFDVIFSNAVLEHVYDVGAVMAELARVTAPGGVHIHQVDLRDHRNFDRPLEYLLQDPEEAERFHRDYGPHWGSLRRDPDYASAYAAAGLAVTQAYVTARATPEYLDDLIPRLRSHPASSYRECPRETLERVGICYFMRKPA